MRKLLVAMLTFGASMIAHPAAARDGESAGDDEAKNHFERCRNKADAGEWSAAAQCYVQYARDFPDSSRLDEVLSEAANAYERSDEPAKAIQVRILLLKKRPDSTRVPKVIFQIAGTYQMLASYSRAATFYERFVEELPDREKKAKKALAQAASLRQGLGQYERAIADYERYLELFGGSDGLTRKAAGAAFEIAELHREEEDWTKALEQYRSYLETYADDGPEKYRLMAHLRTGLIHRERGEGDRALEKFERTVEIYENLPRETREKLTEGRDAVAQAKFLTADPLHQKATDTAVEGGNNDELKEKFFRRLDIYEEVVEFERPEWTIAALYKIGTLYEKFARTIRTSEVPDRLTNIQKELYRGILEDEALPVEERAVEAYEQALRVAFQEKWYNEYSQKAAQRLAELRPFEHRIPAELRARPDHVGYGFTRSGILHELSRDEPDVGIEIADEFGE